MIKRIITALIIVVCVVPPLLLGGYLLKALVALIVIVGGFEMVNLLPNRKFIPTILVFIIFALTAAAILIPTPYSISVALIVILLLLIFPIFVSKFTSEDSFFILAVCALLFAFGYSFSTIYEHHALYIWFILLATYGSDTGAYFVGSMFGKTKLIPSISPNKTLEGAIGGWAVGALLSFLFAIFVIKDMNLLLLILGCLWLPITSQLGDLSFSAMKRFYNIKDFSNIFPGHGGFMDRIDSLVFNLIAFNVFLLVIMI